MALAIKDTLLKGVLKPEEKEKLLNFKAGKNWVAKFMNRYDLTLRAITKHTHKIPTDAEEQRLGFMQ